MTDKLRKQAEFDVLSSLGLVPEVSVLKEASFLDRDEVSYQRHFSDALNRLVKSASIDLDALDKMVKENRQVIHNLHERQNIFSLKQDTKTSPMQVGAMAAGATLLGDQLTRYGVKKYKDYKKKKEQEKSTFFNSGRISSDTRNSTAFNPGRRDSTSFNLPPQEEVCEEHDTSSEDYVNSHGKSANATTYEIEAIKKLSKRMGDVEKRSLRNSQRPIGDLLISAGLGGVGGHFLGKHMSPQKINVIDGKNRQIPLY